MQQLITSSKILFYLGQIEVIYQMKAYNHTFLLIIKMKKIFINYASYDVISKIVKNQTKFNFSFFLQDLKNNSSKWSSMIVGYSVHLS